jgi:transcriptional regulator with XRE-family HTH domain
LNSLYERIEKLCQKKNVNVTRMCTEAGVSRGNLTDLKMGRSKTLAAPTLQKLANYFGVSIDYLMGHEAVPSILEFVAEGNGLHAGAQLLVRQREPQGADSKKAASKNRGGFEEYAQLYNALTPENQAKLMELARLFLDAQRGKGEK